MMGRTCEVVVSFFRHIFGWMHFVLTILLIFQLLACVLILQSTGAAPQQGFPPQFQQGDKLSVC